MPLWLPPALLLLLLLLAPLHADQLPTSAGLVAQAVGEAPSPPLLPSAPTTQPPPKPESGPTLPVQLPAESRPAAPTMPTSQVLPSTYKPVIVSEDALTTLLLSAAGLNRLQLPDAITSAHTNSDAIDITLEGTTAIITFRTPTPADVLLMTHLGQFLLRLVPSQQPPQTLRLRLARPEAQTTASYQSQLAGLMEAAYRRDPPRGYSTERPGTPLPIEGALQWWLTLRYKGRILTIHEYTVYNGGALPHALDLPSVISRFPTARAVSVDPALLSPGGWGRVLAIVDTEAPGSTAEGVR